ncbi:uncharacterized protein SCHCODRAFT_02596049 [Schizophyllum commune H4-8]|uniref:RING-type domain-containing protein n=1 Tax=Schizophyllum commune (strain H4-8 / FGSC 9210) TaxID=578458 RepID=D8PV81_SCHCM|nr:uncharacterized protein SCHCODRAFT_02596049 [Schizophyllum commune H4-8]KAI5900459.1 hypothetical protein SCHCODRAFT_02596049 [Schizophyllum commune H4-8]
MKCISTTCKTVIDWKGFRAANCPHIFCEGCYLELVRQTKLENQSVHCPECSEELVLFGTIDLAVVHFALTKKHPVAADLGYNELVERRPHLESLNALIFEQQQQPEIDELPHWLRERHAEFNASAELHSHSIIEVALPAVAQVKLWRQRVRKQATLPETAARRRQQLSVLQAQLKSINRKVAAARKDCAKLSTESQSLFQRLNEVTQRLRKLRHAAHCVRSRVIDSSADRDDPSSYALQIVSWDRRIQEEENRVQIVRSLGHREDEATAKLRESLAAGERELVHLQAVEVPEQARATVIKRKLATTRRHLRTLGTVAMLPVICVSFLAFAVAVPQQYGFSVIRVYRHFTS